MDWFAINSVREKIHELPAAMGRAEHLSESVSIKQLGRDVKVVMPHLLPAKPGLLSREGQARLLHDLASIELQAMELAARSMFEYADAPAEFRKELAELAIGESRHLTLCLDAIESLGYAWGHWDVHLTLWNTVSPTDSLLDRILIVHRYLEGSGLDAGDSILRRLKGVRADRALATVELIVREEIDHVAFGTRWYRKVAELNGIDAEKDFCSRIKEISLKAPRRERIAHSLREQAGFSAAEICAVEACVAT
jgi:uncharacterized ferritin-like protein (DUF455 family)